MERRKLRYGMKVWVTAAGRRRTRARRRATVLGWEQRDRSRVVVRFADGREAMVPSARVHQ